MSGSLTPRAWSVCTAFTLRLHAVCTSSTTRFRGICGASARARGGTPEQAFAPRPAGHLGRPDVLKAELRGVEVGRRAVRRHRSQVAARLIVGEPPTARTKWRVNTRDLQAVAGEAGRLPSLPCRRGQRGAAAVAGRPTLSDCACRNPPARKRLRTLPVALCLMPGRLVGALRRFERTDSRSANIRQVLRTNRAGPRICRIWTAPSAVEPRRTVIEQSMFTANLGDTP
jgi:hypothetical protein